VKVTYLKNLIDLLDSPIEQLNLNSISSKNLPNKVKVLRNFIFTVIVNDFNDL